MGVHDGHRERLRGNFIRHGLDSFNDINALELLLFYAIPRRDTNVTAHALLEAFGSLHGVFSASVQELCQVPGIGENTAALICLIPQLMRKSRISKASAIRTILNSEDAGNYLLPRFMYEEDEVVLMLCLDSQSRVISCTEMGRGVVNSVETSIRRIVETALKNKASSVIMAHNHPDGLAIPSKEDDAVTKKISESLSMVDITLADHLVIAEEEFVSYGDSGFFGAYGY